MATKVVKQSTAKVSDLEPYDRNPRTITEDRFEALKRSIQNDPGLLDARPLIVAGDAKTVLAGNMRLMAARELGWKEVPVAVVDVEVGSPEADRIALLDNNPFGQYNEDQVAEMLYGLKDAGTDLELTGFTDSDLDTFLQLAGAQHSTDFLDDVLEGVDDKPHLGPEVEDPGGKMEMKNDAGDSYYQLSYAVNQEQRDLVLAAIKKAKADGEAGTAPEALAVICRSYVGS